jgi:N-acetylglucosaminyldiphosphoundecaprenol N-acetyl-beta-D-mannosaminyltransferase
MSIPEGAHLAMAPKVITVEWNSVTVCGVSLNAISETECVTGILSMLAKTRGGWAVTHNVDHVRRLRADAQFAEICSTADLRVADGMPLVWLSRIQGTPLPERVAGSSLIISLSEAAAPCGRSIFLLGGNPGTAEAAAAVLVDRFPSLKIAGTDCPRLGFEQDPKHVAELCQRLLAARPDIIYVALGSPKQEHLIVKLREVLPEAWFLGVGISFSFVCGQVKRAPRWMQQCGLEWVHRFAQEPRRLFRRYILQGLPFAFALTSSAIQYRFKRPRTPLVRLDPD